MRTILKKEGVSLDDYADQDVVVDIFLEEGEPYLKGQKDLDTVVDIIGNRLKLYFAEK